jgi:hypothetical protein
VNRLVQLPLGDRCGAIQERLHRFLELFGRRGIYRASYAARVKYRTWDTQLLGELGDGLQQPQRPTSLNAVMPTSRLAAS